MNYRNLCLLASFLLLPCLSRAQPDGFFLSKEPSIPGCYADADSAEAGIRYLLEEAKRNNTTHDYLSVLNNLQLALALEDYAPKNTGTVFTLNSFMGYTLADLNPRYALLFMKKAVAITRIRPELDTGARFHLLGAIAGLHKGLHEPDSARVWYQQACAEAFARYKAPGQASSLNNLGVFYSSLGRSDSAMHYFYAALNVLGGIKYDTILYCSIQDNIAQQYENKGDYAYALNTYRFNDLMFNSRKRWNRILVNRIRLLNAEHRAGYPDSEVSLGIERLADWVEQHRANLLDEDVLQFYHFAKDFFLETGRLTALRRFEPLFTTMKDNIKQKNKEQIDLITSAFLSIQTARFRREIEVHRMESAAARQMTLLVSVTGLTGVGLLLLFMRRRRIELDLAHRLTVSELRTKELEAHAMTQALEATKRDITTVSLHNTQVLDNRRHMVERLSDIVRQKKNMEGFLHALIAELQTQGQLGERAQIAQENIDRVNAEFYQALKNRFPSLTKSEVELCGYLRVGLSNKDIAALKNIAPASVKMGKNRLRKKLGLDAEGDLYGFMQRL